jgi:capsular polysaccharide biosynthesis protein
MEVYKLFDFLTSTESIFPSRVVLLNDVVCFSNTEDIYKNPAFRARSARTDKIDIGRLPPRTTYHGAQLFSACVGDAWIAETIPHTIREQMRLVAPNSTSDPIQIEDECFIATRYGHGTWGHWLGEIFPLVAVAERLYPGRFRYATTFYGAETAWYGSRIVECFAAYGIAENRLFRMVQNRSYTFSAAYTMTAAWSDLILHPDVATVMRGAVQLRPCCAAQRIALLRSGARGRSLINFEPVEKMVNEWGYVSTDVERLSFPQQVALFQSAESIFSVLGSGLTGLVFSPDYVKVGSVRPQRWYDRFFSGLIQLRRGTWADISGPSSGDNAMGDPFTVSEDDVASALQAMHEH